MCMCSICIYVYVFAYNFARTFVSVRLWECLYVILCRLMGVNVDYFVRIRSPYLLACVRDFNILACVGGTAELQTKQETKSTS